MTKISDAQQAFVTKIQVLYDVEKQLEKALPKMAKAAASSDLRDGFETHLEITKNHSARLDKVFEMINSKPKKLSSEGIRGIIDDGDWVAKVEAPDNVKDSMLAGAARYAEHYEMAGYMTAILEADALGHADVASLLSESLAEEEAADDELASIVSRNL